MPHDPIVHDFSWYSCPLCVSLDENRALDRQIAVLTTDNTELDQRNRELEVLARDVSHNGGVSHSSITCPERGLDGVFTGPVGIKVV